MFFNPFAPISLPVIPHKRQSRLIELDMRMQDFLATKHGAASGNVIESVKSARDHIRREMLESKLDRTAK
jgi:hypothetical protein